MIVASPRPWKLDAFYNGIASAKGGLVAYNLTSADAALIVEAVEAYDNFLNLGPTIIERIAKERAECDECDRLRDLVRKLANVAETTLIDAGLFWKEHPEFLNLAFKESFFSEAHALIREARRAAGSAQGRASQEAGSAQGREGNEKEGAR